jgi:hypothetical protein
LEGKDKGMKNGIQYNLGTFGNIRYVMHPICKKYREDTGNTPQVIRISGTGRFSEYIGQEGPFTIGDTTVNIEIIGGEKSQNTCTVGLKDEQQKKQGSFV